MRLHTPENSNVTKTVYIYIYAFIRRFYPKRLTIAFRLYIFISMCVPRESNPQPFALLTQCSTTEPHRNTGMFIQFYHLFELGTVCLSERYKEFVVFVPSYAFGYLLIRKRSVKTGRAGHKRGFNSITDFNISITNFNITSVTKFTKCPINSLPYHHYVENFFLPKFLNILKKSLNIYLTL